jgi:hypothetical protein
MGTSHTIHFLTPVFDTARNEFPAVFGGTGAQAPRMTPEKPFHEPMGLGMNCSEFSVRKCLLWPFFPASQRHDADGIPPAPERLKLVR